MSWIEENLQILATLGSALAVYIALRAGSRKDTNELSKKIDKIENELPEMRREIQCLDSRLARIEEYLTGIAYHWEPKIVQKENKE